MYQAFDGTVLGGYQPPKSGLSLTELLERAEAAGRELPLELALHIGVGAIEAVARAHQLRGEDGDSLVHGNISASAVFITPRGEVQLGRRAGGDDRADDPLCCGGLLAELAGDSLPELAPIIDRATNVGSGSGYASVDQLAADLSAEIRRARLTSSNHRLAMWLGELVGSPVHVHPDEMVTIAREPAPSARWILPRTVPSPIARKAEPFVCAKTLPPIEPRAPLAFTPVPAFATTADVPPLPFRVARGSDVWSTASAESAPPARPRSHSRVRNVALALSVGALAGAIASMLSLM